MNNAFAPVGPAAALAIVPPPPTRVVPVLDADPLRAAQHLLKAGDVTGALSWLDRAVAAAPSLPIAHLGRAVCLAQLGREDDAFAALDQALQSPNMDPLMPLQLAKMCARAGQESLAMGLLEVAVAAAPEHAERALKDEAFAGLRDHPRFLLIVGAL